MTETVRCPHCETKLLCRECDDTRPTAGDLYPGWQFRSAFGRWETVSKIDDTDRFGKVLVWTDESGAMPWRLSRSQRLEARPDARVWPGGPEIRVVEDDDRFGSMFVIACNSSQTRVLFSDTAERLASAYHDQAWKVHQRMADGTSRTVECESKAKARTELRRIAREFAKLYKVSLNLNPV